MDISKKISIECSCIKRPHGGLFYKWKLIPPKLIKKSFGDELKFHSNVSFNNSMSDIFHAFTKIFDLTGNSVYQKIMKPSQAFFYKIYGSTTI